MHLRQMFDVNLYDMVIPHQMQIFSTFDDQIDKTIQYLIFDNSTYSCRHYSESESTGSDVNICL